MQRAFVDAQCQSPADVLVMGVIGLSLPVAVRQLLRQSGQAMAFADAIVERFRDYYRQAEQEIVLYPDVIETLELLQARGYWMGVVTGKSRSGLERVLERFDLKRFFAVWRTADCCHSKPHPAMALECMDEMGVTAQQTTLVGDADFDMQMAKAAHVRAIGVSFGVASAEALYQQGATQVVDAFAELQACFSPLN